jgi:transcriptional regulator with XRE-family HTH domain
MPTPAEIRTTLKSRIARINVSLSDLSRIAGMTLPTLSNFIAGRFEPPLQTLQRLHKTVNGLERLARVCSPVPVDFRNAPLVQDLISRLNSGVLEINVYDSRYPRTDLTSSGGLAALCGFDEKAHLANLATQVAHVCQAQTEATEHNT